VNQLNTLGRVLALTAFCTAPVRLLAAEAAGDANTFQYGLSAGATYSDNIGRTSTNKDTDTSADAGFFATLRHDRARLVASLDADINYQARSGGVYPDTLNGGLAAMVAYRLFHDRLTWTVEDNLGQALLNAQDAVTPGNTQNLNVFSTGPDVVYPLGARTSLTAQGRWTDTSYEESDFGTRGLTGTVGIARQLGEHSSLSLNGSAEKTKYKNLPSSSDYDTKSVYLTWSATGARTTLDLDAGYTSLKGQLDSTGSMTFALGVERQLTSRSSLSLNAGRDFGDAAGALQRGQEIGDVSSGDRPVEATADPRRSDYFSVGWGFDGQRSGLSLSADWRKDTQTRSVDQNRKSLGAGLQVTREVGPRLGLDFHTNYRTEDFSTAAVEFDEWDIGLGMNWSIARGVGVNLSWDHFVGDGDTSLGAGTRDFNENRYSLSLSWSPEQ
jgi:hypothetical protein